MNQHSKRAWLNTGLSILAQDGQAGLTIAAMAERLERTKGSFYHHFNSMADFEQQLVDHWAGQYLSTNQQLSEDIQARLPLLDKIMAEGYFKITGPELAIRAWAQQDEQVRTRVEQVDRLRRDFLRWVFHSLIADEAQAQQMADLLFALLIGSLSALPRYTPKQTRALYAEFKRLYGLD